MPGDVSREDITALAGRLNDVVTGEDNKSRPTPFIKHCLRNTMRKTKKNLQLKYQLHLQQVSQVFSIINPSMSAVS